ncbi:hypothetical protein Taro_041199, partial [Colocasia esculenta]|nr:hypothetical protein [Colocasia esculenta]
MQACFQQLPLLRTNQTPFPSFSSCTAAHSSIALLPAASADLFVTESPSCFRVDSFYLPNWAEEVVVDYMKVVGNWHEQIDWSFDILGLVEALGFFQAPLLPASWIASSAMPLLCIARPASPSHELRSASLMLHLNCGTASVHRPQCHLSCESSRSGPQVRSSCLLYTGSPDPHGLCPIWPPQLHAAARLRMQACFQQLPLLRTNQTPSPSFSSCTAAHSSIALLLAASADL